jgi:ADP-ribose pyrophosphatase YjhB (NUDIX family)
MPTNQQQPILDHQLSSNFRVSLKALVRGPDHSLLLVKEGGDGWGMPGGGLNHGESIEQGLRREVGEELGCEIDAVPALPVLAEPYFYAPFNRWRLWLLYEVTLRGEPRIGADSTDIGWFNHSTLPSLTLDETEEVAVREVFQRFG